MKIAPTEPLNIDDLLQRIRVEAKRREVAGVFTSYSRDNERLEFVTEEIPAQPALHVSDLEVSQTDQKFRQLLNRATLKTTVSRWVPKPFRCLFRKQGAFNDAVISALNIVMKSQQRLLRQTVQMIDYLNAQANWLRTTTNSHVQDRERLHSMSASLSKVDRHMQALATTTSEQLDLLCEQVSYLRHHVDDSDDRIQRIEGVVNTEASQGKELKQQIKVLLAGAEAEAKERDAIGGLVRSHSVTILDLAESAEAARAAIDAEVTERESVAGLLHSHQQILFDMRETVQSVRASLHAEVAQREAITGLVNSQQETLRTLQASVRTAGAGIDAEMKERESLGGLVQSQQKVLDSLAANLPRLHDIPSGSEFEKMKATVVLLQDLTEALQERQIADSSHFQRELYLHVQRLSTPVMTGTRGTTRKPKEVEIALPDQHQFDAFYLHFENKFRGTRGDIKQRVRVHLSTIIESGAGAADAPILDLGCGRGEWIELLSGENLVSSGVDLNEFMVAECVARGLPAKQADILDYLTSLPDGSQGAITAFHLIEHLPFASFLKLFSESLRVLRVGGVCIVETPNPDNVLVGSNTFYMDPTHVRPLPKDYTKFVMTTAGFNRVSVLPLHPAQTSLPTDKESEPVERLVNQMFFGEQDYAVVGWK